MGFHIDIWIIEYRYVELKDWFRIHKTPFEYEARWTIARERSIEHAVEMVYKRSIGKRPVSKKTRTYPLLKTISKI